MTAAVEIAGVNKIFGDLQALTDVNLNIEAGSYVVLLGPSGCGKTTLLFAIGGFHDPSSGSIRIGGRDMTGVPPAKRPTTTMFQDYALFPHLSLIDNVAFGPRMAGVGRKERRADAAEMLALVGLPNAGARKPAELSGGQRQRVALARALAVRPDVLLLDEPLGALDLSLRRQMQIELKRIQRQVGTTFIHVTHDQEEAMAIADLIVLMRQGRIEDAGPAERVYSHPASQFTASFMGEVNLVPAAKVPGTAAAPDAVISLRPEAFRDPGDTPVSLGNGTVTEVTFLGTHWRALVTPDVMPEASWILHLPAGEQVIAGESVTMRVDPARLAAVS